MTTYPTVLFKQFVGKMARTLAKRILEATKAVWQIQAKTSDSIDLKTIKDSQ